MLWLEAEMFIEKFFTNLFTGGLRGYWYCQK